MAKPAVKCGSWDVYINTTAMSKLKKILTRPSHGNAVFEMRWHVRKVGHWDELYLNIMAALSKANIRRIELVAFVLVDDSKYPPHQDRMAINKSWIPTLLLLVVILGACASPTSRSGEEAISSADARKTGKSAFSTPGGCFYRSGQPVRPHRSNLAYSECQPSGAVVHGRRAPRQNDDAPTFDRGSLELPPSPVPLPSGVGVMR